MKGLLAIATLALTVVAGAAGAFAQDAVLYEVTEAVSLEGLSVGGVGFTFQSSTATLMGKLKVGSPLCPASLATTAGASTCTIAVTATGRADDNTGVGPVSGTIRVMVQDWNRNDGAEVVAEKATFSGTLDLSPAAQRGVPLGSISGTYKSQGTGLIGGLLSALLSHSGHFKGTFRLPFDSNGQASYLTPAGVVPIAPAELTLGIPAVRLEIDIID